MELTEILFRLLGILTLEDVKEMISAGRGLEAAQVLGKAAELAVAWHERRLLSESDYSEFKKKHRELSAPFDLKEEIE